MKLSPEFKNKLYTYGGTLLTAVGVAVVEQLAKIPELQRFAPFIMSLGTLLLGKQLLERAK